MSWDRSMPCDALNSLHQPVDDRLVEVVAAEVVVAGSGLDLEHAVADLEHRHVERAAAEVEDEDRLVGLLVESVRERRGRRLVDDPLDVEPGDLAGVLGRLALVVVEVGGHRDHGAVDRLAKVSLGVSPQLLEDHRADLGRRVLVAARLHARVAVRASNDLERDDLLLLLHLRFLASHEPLDRANRVLRVRHRLPPRDRADEALAAWREGDDRRRRPGALRVLDDRRLTALEHGHARVGGTEVDSDRLRHLFLLERARFLGFLPENLSQSMADRKASGNRSSKRRPCAVRPRGARPSARIRRSTGSRGRRRAGAWAPTSSRRRGRGSPRAPRARCARPSPARPPR